MRIVASIVLAGVLIAIMTAPALGQGTSGTLPEPVSTQELEGYAARLKLSEQQRQAAHVIHDQYKQEFRALRQGEIAAFLKDMRNMTGGMPSREKMESFMKTMGHLTGKIAAIDNRMFDQMQAILTEEQLAQMTRVRMARQRTRFGSSQMTWVAGNRSVDLSEILLEADLAAEHQQLTDPILSQYEGKLTSAMGKLYDASTNMIMNMYKALEDLGFNEESMSNPEQAEKMGEAMQQIWRDVTAQAMEAGAAISDLNQRTFKTIAPLLPEDTARSVRRQYYKRAYPQAGYALGDDTSYHDAALKLEQITAEQRESLTAGRAELQRKMDQLIEDIVAVIDKSTRDFSPFDFNSEKMQEFQKKLAELQGKVGEVRTAAMQEVTAIVGEDLAKKISQSAAAKMAGQAKTESPQVELEASDGAAGMAQTAEGDESDMDEAQVAHGVDQFVPNGITKRELNGIASRLKLNEEQKTILGQLHSSYLEKFKAVQEKEIAAVAAAAQAMWRWDESTGQNQGPTTESIEQTYRLRQEAAKAVHALDQAFFDDIEVALLEEQQAPLMKRVRMARERTTCSRGQELWGSWMGGSNEGKIDLSQFLARQKLSEQDLAAIDGELLDYESAATGAFKSRHEAAMKLQRAQELWQAEMMKARSEGESNPMKISARYQEFVGEPSKQMNETGAAIKRLNRETLDRILAKLSADNAGAVRRAFNLRAFPDVYTDELAMEQRLNDALKLPDLSPEQQRRLGELAAEYRSAYASLSDQMVEISASGENPSFSGDDTEGWKKWQERREAVENLKFDRNELNLRAISQVRAMLSEDHIRRIGGLPEPKKKDGFEMW